MQEKWYFERMSQEIALASIFKQLFDPLITLDLEVWERFAALGEVQNLPQGTVLKQAGATEEYFTLLLDGSGGLLLWHKDKYVCTDLCLPNDLVMDYISFVLKKASPGEVRLFEDSRLFRMSRQDFQRTLSADAFGTAVSLQALQGAYAEKLRHQADLLAMTAKERYIDLLDSRPGVSRIPIRYIASYLGITPQSMSRIRAEKI